LVCTWHLSQSQRRTSWIPPISLSVWLSLLSLLGKGSVKWIPPFTVRQRLDKHVPAATNTSNFIRIVESVCLWVSLYFHLSLLRNNSFCYSNKSRHTHTHTHTHIYIYIYINIHVIAFALSIPYFKIKFVNKVTSKHNRPLWVAVQGLIRPTPYTYIHNLPNWEQGNLFASSYILQFFLHIFINTNFCFIECVSMWIWLRILFSF
jgi:hypothetical protein